MLPDLPPLTLAGIGYGSADLLIVIGAATVLVVAIAIVLIPRKKRAGASR